MPSVAIIGTRGYPSYYGGFETAVRRLAPYLVDRGWGVTVYGRPGATRIDDPERDTRVRSVETRGWDQRSLSTLTFGYHASRQAVRERHDVALVMNVANGFWLPILNRASIPTLVNVDGIEWDRAKWGRVARYVFRRGARLTAKHASSLVFDARAIAERWRQDFAVGGHFIPYGGEPVAEGLPVEPGLQRDKYVLAVARFVPENSIPEFFAAARQLAEFTDVVIVGSSGYGGELDREAELLSHAHSRVHWLGHVNNDSRLHSLWHHAGAYFHGHTVGGTNPALVQAMACGAPTVARDTVYNREVLGNAGVFVDGSADEIAHALLTLVRDDDLRQKLRARAIERSTTFYSWEMVCDSYERALRDLVGGSSKATA